MRGTTKPTIREALAALASTHALVVTQMEQMIELLNLALDAEELVKPNARDLHAGRTANTPRVNRLTLSVEWDGKSCFLGNTLLFRFFERIARTPNIYVPHIDLLDDVWGGDRDSASIRGVVKRLRDQLAKCHMESLAKAIDGSVSGCYGLILV